jgi:hypothetical protein
MTRNCRATCTRTLKAGNVSPLNGFRTSRHPCRLQHHHGAWFNVLESLPFPQAIHSTLKTCKSQCRVPLRCPGTRRRGTSRHNGHEISPGRPLHSGTGLVRTFSPSPSGVAKRADLH